MKVLIVTHMTPFAKNDVDDLAMHLQKNLILAKHEAEILRIPFCAEPTNAIPSQMLMVRAFELFNVDHVIALAFPAYLIRHPRKVLWLLHDISQTYNLPDTDANNLYKNELNDNIQLLIKNAKYESFAESRHIYTNSEIIQKQLYIDHHINATFLQLPKVNTDVSATCLDLDNWQPTIEALLR